MRNSRSILAVALAVMIVPALAVVAQADKISDTTEECLECHTGRTPGITTQWEKSSHWQNGVGCYECHQANKDDADAMDHNGHTIAVIVSPRDCGRCHEKETAEQEASHHAKAGDILNTGDGLLGQTVGGEPAVAVGCRQCHGSLVKVMDNGKLDPTTWPNTGIGRVNPDQSKGTCSACHTRHRFSKEQARKPDVCGKCHLGPDHPQKEVYEESKHGILYAAFEDELNMDRPKWVAGEDYFDAPTCSSCHMSASKNLPVTHDVGDRLSWNLRAPISKRTENSEAKLKAMQDVCTSCHGGEFVTNFYTQLNEFVGLYNDKFAIPAKEIRDILIKEECIPAGDFNDKIDWIYWELWHHEGRRARHGAAMSGPDYAWWHGIYDVAKNFYTEMLPEAKEACESVGKGEVYEKILKTYIEDRPEHEWYVKGFDPERVKKMKAYYLERYQQKVQ